jgi:hypothetical protein
MQACLKWVMAEPILLRAWRCRGPFPCETRNTSNFCRFVIDLMDMFLPRPDLLKWGRLVAGSCVSLPALQRKGFSGGSRMNIMLRLSVFPGALYGFCVILSAHTVAQDKPSAVEKPAADAPTSSVEKYLLRFNFKEGETLRYETEQRVTQKAVAAVGAKVDLSTVKQTRLFRVGDVSEQGEAQVSMQFEYVRMELRSDDQPMEVFDTSMKESEVPTKFRAAARKLMRPAPTFTLRTEGTPVSDEGVEQIPKGGQAGFMMPLPPEPIAVGQTWKVNIQPEVRIAEGVMRKISLLRTYRLKEVEGDVAIITFATSVASKVRSPAIKAQLLQATPRGTVMFNVKLGRVLERELTFDRSVMGAVGPNTILSAKGRTTEILLPDEAEPKAVSAR